MTPTTQPRAGQAHHTPLPWSWKDGWSAKDEKRDKPPTMWVQLFGANQPDGERGDFIWQLEAPIHDSPACLRVLENAKFLVTAVNSHAQLTADLTTARAENAELVAALASLLAPRESGARILDSQWACARAILARHTAQAGKDGGK